MIIFGLLSSSVLSLEGRNFRPILSIPALPESTTRFNPEQGGPPPFTRSQCEQLIRNAVGAYGSGSFGQYLSPSFSNADALKDSLNRVGLNATNIKLQIQSIPRLRISNWKKINARLYTAECVVDVLTRLRFDNANTGATTVKDAGRSTWHLKFEARAP